MLEKHPELVPTCQQCGKHGHRERRCNSDSRRFSETNLVYAGGGSYRDALDLVRVCCLGEGYGFLSQTPNFSTGGSVGKLL
jgi:hypothetical protein